MSPSITIHRPCLSVHVTGFFIALVILFLEVSHSQAQTLEKPDTSHTSSNIKPVAPGQRFTLENRHYEDDFTFKHGNTYIFDPYVWAYTREFAERFRMPEKWIEPELKGALAVAFRMSNIGNTMCGLARNESNCWPNIECQMDIYYDSSIQLPWNYPEHIRDTSLTGISSSQYLHFTPDSRIRKYVSKTPGGRQGIMNVGGGLVHGKNNGWPSSIIYYDREYEPGVALIGYRGKGVCPQYVGPDEVSMPFESNEDFQKFRRFQLAEKDIRIVHRIIFPKPFLVRANASYIEQNKPKEKFLDSIIDQFHQSRATKNSPPKKEE